MALALDALPVGCAVLLIFALYQFVVYPAFLTPLARIPSAHWTCSISPYWILWKRLRHKQNGTVLAAHRIHGPIVRLGPKELSVNCVDGGYKTIYTGAFHKDDYYRFFDNFGTCCMFSTPHSAPHSTKRRFISQIYSKSSIQQSPVIAAQARVILYDRFFPILEHAAASSPPKGIDVYSLYQAFGFDTISAFYLGLQCSTNFLQDVRTREKWRRQFLSRVPYAVWMHEAPGLLRSLAKIGLRIVPREVDHAIENLDSMVRQWYQKTIYFMENHSGNFEDAGDEPLALSAIVTGWKGEQKSECSKIEKRKLDDPELSILSELADNLAAGYETSGITMMYISWHLSQKPKIQDLVRGELRSLQPAMLYPPDTRADERILPDPKALDALPLVDAVVMETLRLHGAVPGGQPRIVPQGGCQLGSYKNIPAGTRVASSAWVLHRNPVVFPNPEKWDPFRWLGGDIDAAKERDRWFWAFSSGPRTCAGKNFAFHELKHLIAAVYTNYKTHVVNDDGIEQLDGHTKGPKADAIYLGFTRAG